jgi:hypothetical protein
MSHVFLHLTGKASLHPCAGAHGRAAIEQTREGQVRSGGQADNEQRAAKYREGGSARPNGSLGRSVPRTPVRLNACNGVLTPTRMSRVGVRRRISLPATRPGASPPTSALRPVAARVLGRGSSIKAPPYVAAPSPTARLPYYEYGPWAAYEQPVPYPNRP